MRYNCKTPRYSLLLVLCSLFALHLQAKNPVGTWKTYSAYQDATLVAETPNLVFAVYQGLYSSGTHNDGALFSYSPEDKEITTYSFTEGLNDVNIKQMVYAPEVKALVLVYENSNIDLFFGKNNVVNIPSIKNKTDYPDRTINSVIVIGKYAYFATAFGIVIIDLERKEVKTECKLEINTTAVCLSGDYIYAATNEGVKRALMTTNLVDKENWEPFKLSYEGDEKKIEKMVIFKDQLVFFDGAGVYYQTKEGTVQLIFKGSCRQLSVLNDQLILNLYNQVYFYTDPSKSRTRIMVTASAISSYNSNDIYWIAQPIVSWVDPSQTGLIAVKKEIDSDEYSLLDFGITVNSPLRNYCVNMTYMSDKLLVTGGDRWSDRNNKEGTFMIYENGKWTNFDDRIIAEKTGLLLRGTPWCRDLMSAVVDPRDPSRYFVTSYGEGLYEFNDTAFVNLYSLENSVFQSSNPNYYPEFYVRLEGLAYDKNNNLYIINPFSTNGLIVYTADKKWIPLSYPPLSGVHPNQVLITRNNQKWINNIRLESAGIFVLDDNNTIDDQNDDTYYYSNRFVDQQNEDIKAINYMCLAEDLNGTVWVGTDNGLISFSSAEQVGRGECNRIISTDSYNEGYRPLEGEFVTAIAVDGGNRKWVGTRYGGVFVVDYSGSTLNVTNFNTSNSKIISDNILSLAIDNKTGEVFIGTDKGIISYMNEAIEGQANYSNVYAYPNPVKPANKSEVIITGLMANSTIKITDIAGNLMHTGNSLGGQYTWNCTNRAGAIVKAGIYLVFAALPDGTQGVVTKIMVIK